MSDIRDFFKIRPGLWGLTERREEILAKLSAAGSPKETEQFDHSYFQGLAVEVGNFKGYRTCVPSQDRNRRFLSRKMSDLCSLPSCPPFTYESIVKRAQTVDVVWFNERRLPSAFIEVEFTTDFVNSMLKFTELQDFRAKFLIVADRARQREYQARAEPAFATIRPLVNFMDFDQLADAHSKLGAASTVSL